MQARVNFASVDGSLYGNYCGHLNLQSRAAAIFFWIWDSPVVIFLTETSFLESVSANFRACGARESPTEALRACRSQQGAFGASGFYS